MRPFHMITFRRLLLLCLLCFLSVSTHSVSAEPLDISEILFGQDTPSANNDQMWIKYVLSRAEMGKDFAQLALGEIYLKGEGLPQDYKKAAYWFTKAAEQGEPASQFYLGVMYSKGQGVPQNHSLAYVWSSLSAASGDTAATHNRDIYAKKLTTHDLAEAQAIATQLQEKINIAVAKSATSPQTPGKYSFFKEQTDTQSLPSQLSVVPPEPTFIGSGSGFVITPEGHILTCAHVVEQATAIKIKLGGHIVDAKIIRQDQLFDLALLKVTAQQPLSALSFSKSRSATLGQDVFTVGFPNPELQGVATKLTKGSISSLAGALDDSRIYQISVPVQPGNSGGPLLDYNGNVVGVVQAQIEDRAVLNSSGSLPQNINYAVKSAYALSLIDSLPEVGNKLPAPDSRPRSFESAASAAESSVVLVLVYK